MLEIITRSAGETKKVAAILAEEIQKQQSRAAQVIALSGNLGAGKTTFVQGFADAWGIKENVLSPTFVLMKVYAFSKGSARRKSPRHLVHVDCYRMESFQDLAHLGFAELLRDRDTVIILEWAERVKKILPKNTLWIYFSHAKNPEERNIIVEQ